MSFATIFTCSKREPTIKNKSVSFSHSIGCWDGVGRGNLVGGRDERFHGGVDGEHLAVHVRDAAFGLVGEGEGEEGGAPLEVGLGSVFCLGFCGV